MSEEQKNALALASIHLAVIAGWGLANTSSRDVPLWLVGDWTEAKRLLEIAFPVQSLPEPEPEQ